MQMKFNVPLRRSSISRYHKHLIIRCFHIQEDLPGDSMTQTQHQTPNPCWCPGTGGPGEELEPGTASTHQPGQGEAPPEAPRAPLSHCQLNFHVNLWKILVFSIYKVFAYLAGDVPVMPLSVSLLLAVLG